MLDSLPQWLVDFSTGLGDIAIGATLGLVTVGNFTGPDARAAFGIDGGVTESVAYKAGVGTGIAGTLGVGRIAAGNVDSSAASSIPDSNIVTRGGANITAESIEAGTSETPVGRGFSANSAPTVEGAATDIMHNKIGVTTAGEIRAAGGEVHDTSHPRNPTHVTVTGLKSQQASKLLSPSVKNPVPKCDRRCLK